MDPPGPQCPSCGSARTREREDLEQWECKYCPRMTPVEEEEEGVIPPL